jgi:mono/diheme cytochrome c family protein
MYRYIFFILIIILAYHCQKLDKHKRGKANQNEVSNKQEGEALAHTCCGSCHVFPEPDLLPKKVWMKKKYAQYGYSYGYENGFSL